jgi:hypothetical protein
LLYASSTARSGDVSPCFAAWRSAISSSVGRNSITRFSRPARSSQRISRASASSSSTP